MKEFDLVIQDQRYQVSINKIRKTKEVPYAYYGFTLFPPQGPMISRDGFSTEYAAYIDACKLIFKYEGGKV